MKNIINLSFVGAIIIVPLVMSHAGSTGNFLHKKFNTMIISLRTKSLVRDIIDLEQQVLQQMTMCAQANFEDEVVLALLQEPLQLLREILQRGLIDSVMFDRIFEWVTMARQRALQQNFCRSKSDVWIAWWNFLQKKIDALQLPELQQDLHEMHDMMGMIAVTFKDDGDFDDKTSKLCARLVALCYNMIHHFDGFWITEYELLLLSSLMRALTLSC